MRFATLLFGIAISSGLFAQVPSYVPATDLIGWWPFNGNANDESGGGNDGTLFGPVPAGDRNGTANAAYDFDGVPATSPFPT